MASSAAVMGRRRLQRSSAAGARVFARVACLLFLAATLAFPAATAEDEIVYSEEEVQQILEDVYETNVTERCNKLNNAEWNYETNISPETEQLLQDETLEYAQFEKRMWEDVFRHVNYSNFQNETLKRQLEALSVLGIPALPEEEIVALSNCSLNMTSTYSTAKICPYGKPNCGESEMLSLDPGIEERLSKSRDYDELVYLWDEWRKQTGKKMRENYKTYVDLNNRAAKLNEFDDMGEMWRHDYDSVTLKEDMLKLWESIEPLYDQLHKYVGKKLRAQYPQLAEFDEKLLPAHIFGNMWAQSWVNIFDLVKPFPESSAVNVTQSLIEQNYTAERMFQTSDEFYLSLGLKDNSMSYGELAMITKPSDREVVCHASAWDFCNGEDYRIKMCTKTNMEDFVTIHHEMGHIQYFIQYKDQPYVFRKGANPGFHEAIGDTIALSVSTPNHLKKVGLLNESYPDTHEDNINALMSTALEKVAFLPFGLLIDMWRWDVFSGNVSSDKWNAHWWELRETIQRVTPPVKRTEDDFDPGAKFHVPGDSQYIAYFIAHILQFQFHKALCIAAGQYDPNNDSLPLHKCDIYESLEAGKLLEKGLKLGGSQNWVEALHAITGERDYSGDALMEYFKPLYDFLREENEKETTNNNNEDGSTNSQLVPIIVGSVLGGVLVCILIGYCVIRRRNSKRSVSVISGNTGSKNLP